MACEVRASLANDQWMPSAVDLQGSPSVTKGKQARAHLQTGMELFYAHFPEAPACCAESYTHTHTHNLQPHQKSHQQREGAHRYDASIQ